MEIKTDFKPLASDFADDFFGDLGLFDIKSNSEYLDKLFKFAKFITVFDSVSAKIVSFLAYYENPSYAFISMLWTSRQYRNRGFGSSLVKKLIDFNHPEIRIKVRRNLTLIGFYEGLGFRSFDSTYGNETVTMRRNSGVAIMQPYFLPSLQYFQLIGAVKSFVFLDDVNFRKKSFVNRNTIRSHWSKDDTLLLTVPISRTSQNRSIYDTNIASESNWRHRIQKSILHSYSNAPNFEDIFFLIKTALKEDYGSIGALSQKLIEFICEYLNINVDFYSSFQNFPDSKALPAISRLAHITQSLGSSQYINSIGGVQIYKKEDFQKLNVNLNFLKCDDDSQNLASNLVNYSFLDNLMRFNRQSLQDQLTSYKLI